MLYEGVLTTCLSPGLWSHFRPHSRLYSMLSSRSLRRDCASSPTNRSLPVLSVASTIDSSKGPCSWEIGWIGTRLMSLLYSDLCFALISASVAEVRCCCDLEMRAMNARLGSSRDSLSTIIHQTLYSFSAGGSGEMCVSLSPHDTTGSTLGHFSIE